ncbi:MAG: RsmD family RNA methyltransferase [Treponema sp.]|jgi:16S rRNA (guanine(966)-N(2))-methyltransferase RsmD|nr:RsmD family RNA methyltransferase [Treponema sp.]
MRITGGTLCGRRVAMPEGIIRPAMDIMRESIFAKLGDLTGLSFLDLFTGSGVIALEAASRGACLIEAVEKDLLKRKTLLQNATVSPVRISCRFMSVELYIRRSPKTFDLVFCDPPFPYKFKQELVRTIAQSSLMKTGSRLLLHRPNEETMDFVRETENLVLEESKKYGRSIVDFFVKK